MTKNIDCKQFIRIHLIFSLMICFSRMLFADSSMSDTKYQEALDNQTRYHHLLREADNRERRGDLAGAIVFHEKAFYMAKDSSLEPVSRGELARLYERNGDYAKALENVKWFLEKSNASSPLWAGFLTSQQRLLQKSEAQKRGEKVADALPTSLPSANSQPIRQISDFHTADYASQKRFMQKELPEDTEIHRLSKQAMLAEHAGKFDEAKKFYELMLDRKEEVVAAFHEVGWVMLHPAIQRTSEVLGDEEREKEMLLWIRDQMLSEKGQYHQYLNRLLPAVQDHLKERLKKEETG